MTFIATYKENKISKNLFLKSIIIKTQNQLESQLYLKIMEMDEASI